MSKEIKTKCDVCGSIRREQHLGSDGWEGTGNDIYKAAIDLVYADHTVEDLCYECVLAIKAALYGVTEERDSR